MKKYLKQVDIDAKHSSSQEEGGNPIPSNEVRKSVQQNVNRLVSKEEREAYFKSDRSLIDNIPSHLLNELGYSVEGENVIKIGKPITSEPTKKLLPEINAEFYEGDLTFKDYQSLGYIPSIVIGNLNFQDCIDATELVLPEIIQGNLNLSGLTLAQNLILSKEITGTINLSGLSQVEIQKLKKIYNLVPSSVDKGVYILKKEKTNEEIDREKQEEKEWKKEIRKDISKKTMEQRKLNKNSSNLFKSFIAFTKNLIPQENPHPKH